MTILLDDEIITEVRAIRDAHAAKFNYDIDAIAADLMKSQAERLAQGFIYVHPPAHEAMPNTALQRTRFVRR